MPMYDFECPAGHVFEELHNIARRPDIVICPHCDQDAKRIITIQREGVQVDYPEWITDGSQTAALITPARGQRPIESRSDLKRFLRENPNIKQIG